MKAGGKELHMEQISLDFEPGFTDRFETLEDVLVSMVYGGRKRHNAIAMDLDESPSSLTRKIKGDLDFPVRKLSALIESTGDLTPIYWLIEKHLAPKPGEREQALRRAMTVLEGHPDLQAVVDSLIKAGGQTGVQRLRTGR